MLFVELRNIFTNKSINFFSQNQQRALKTGMIVSEFVRGGGIFASIGLVVVSVLMLTNVVPGGLPVAITTGAVGVLAIGGGTLYLVFRGVRKPIVNYKEQYLPIRATLFVLSLLFGGTLVTLGALHGAALLNVHQLAYGIIGASGGALLLSGALYTAIAVPNILRNIRNIIGS